MDESTILFLISRINIFQGVVYFLAVCAVIILTTIIIAQTEGGESEVVKPLIYICLVILSLALFTVIFVPTSNEAYKIYKGTFTIEENGNE